MLTPTRKPVHELELETKDAERRLHAWALKALDGRMGQGACGGLSGCCPGSGLWKSTREKPPGAIGSGEWREGGKLPSRVSGQDQGGSDKVAP